MSVMDYLAGQAPKTRVNGGWRLEYRDALVTGNEDPAIPWGLVATAGREKTLRDEVLAPSFPWRAGDLLIMRSPNGAERACWVGTEQGFVSPGNKLPPKLAGTGGGWLQAWEGSLSWARPMLQWSGAVDRRRLVLAACACARTAEHLLAQGDSTPRTMVAQAKAWARGEVAREAIADEVPRVMNRIELLRVELRDRWDSVPANAALGMLIAFTLVSAQDSNNNIGLFTRRASESAARARWRAGEIAEMDAQYEMAPLVREFIPLPVFLLAHLGQPAPSYLRL